MRPDDEAFRLALRDIVTRSGFSMRQLSSAMGRDPGYVAALLDPGRPSRARPTPADLLGASDATGIPLVELLDRLWGIEPARLAAELGRSGAGGPLGHALEELTDTERASVGDFAAYLAARHPRHRRGRTPKRDPS